MSLKTKRTMVEIGNKLNKDVAARDMLIFGEYDIEKYSGGTREFDNMNLDILTKLVEEGYIDLNDRQNWAPSIREFMEFMKKYPEYKAHGYTVERERSDYRVSIEGIIKKSPIDNLQEKKDFHKAFRFADELDESRGYCWFD